tara:strand:- start:303 stop:1046 length:744 start_codon:yes stop_codon:yes gene_type:complete
MAPGINETYNKYFNRHGEFTGTEDDKENEDYKLMIKQINERGRLLQDFNNSMNEEFSRLSKELIAEDISFFNASGYSNALQRARHFVIKEDFDEDNDSVQNAKLQNIANMTYEGGAFTDEQLKNAKAKKIADAQARILATKSEITASGVFESSFVRGDAPDQAYTRNNVSSTSVLGDIQKKYNEVMKDNVLTASENRDISSMINQMQSDYGNMGDDDKELLLKLEDLIAVVKQNSNIIVDNTMDGTD